MLTKIQEIDLLIETIDELGELFDYHKCPRLTNTNFTMCDCDEILKKGGKMDHWKFHIVFEDYFHAFEHIYQNKELIKRSLIKSALNKNGN
jgi:hypothetical protein